MKKTEPGQEQDANRMCIPRKSDFVNYSTRKTLVYYIYMICDIYDMIYDMIYDVCLLLCKVTDFEIKH